MFDGLRGFSKLRDSSDTNKPSSLLKMSPVQNHGNGKPDGARNNY